jgi:ribose-phosphate pyrophosphokinase
VAGCVDEIKGSKILIIDDICSRGGTFYFSAKKLKELGAKEVYLYVTHCENTIFEGEIFTSGLIEKVYTTNSILRKTNEKIEVFEL